jgi:hypothetical protein
VSGFKVKQAADMIHLGGDLAIAPPQDVVDAISLAASPPPST